MSDLTIDRLLLRQWKESDREPFAALNADPAVMEHFPKTFTREQSDTQLAAFTASIDTRGFGFWAVEVRETGRFIGLTGLSVPSFGPPFLPAREPITRAEWEARS
ncbi:GNAT family N-acetyltransferase [Kribbella qitaiheensis]|uniref:GNAT family N-acetyltransferase n=1 Tax=Kribbella qitaiheensis TaxID=1544730 RepID=A0A7G6WXR9_9ACTN|nr:GNAT family N-acetyltransferase [Kribbella qitaiheensis]QNE18784.1 GNAT family N-acetyltransferase [Kribbella qitaiheensis]